MNVPVLLAIGGWTDSAGDKYSRMVSDPQKRSQFIQNAVTFLKRYNFYGLSFEWNYPKCWQSDCRKGPTDDKANFATFISEMRRAFKQNGLMLGVAISGYIEVIRQGYDLRSLSSNVDFLNVMAYDYHGAWEGKTGHISPLYYRDGDMYPQYNVDYTIQEMIKMGAAREKIVLGIPFYGQTFLLKELGQNNQLVGEGAATFGPGNSGEFTKQPGMWAHYEICHKIRNERWNVGRDKESKSGAFASSFNEWVGFDDVTSIEQKMKYVLDNRLGGAAAWTMDLDDFKNRCCGTPFPLLKAINRGLGKYKQPFTTNDCTRPQEPVTPTPAVMTTLGEGGQSDAAHQHTTWPSWQPATMPGTTTQATTSSPWWTPSSSPATTSTTTTTRRPTTTTTTTRRPTSSTTTRRTTTSTWAPETEATTIPIPANVQPIYLDEHCDGNQYKPHPTNCNSYYRCVDMKYTQQNCVAGLHWNQMRTICDWPANAKCTHEDSPPFQDATTTTTTTTRRPTTTPARYTTTTTRRPVSTTTLRTTQRVTTTTRRTTTTKRPTQKPVTTTAWYTTTMSFQDVIQTTTKRPTSPAAATPCVNYSPSKDCTAFFICINNKRVKQRCPQGLQFDATRQICDYPEFVKCVSVKSYARLAMLKVAEGEQGCTEGGYVKDPSDCTKYFLCVHNAFYGQECPNELHFNANSGQCDWPANAKCSPTVAADSVHQLGGNRPASAPAMPEKEIETDVKGQNYNPNDLIPVPETDLQPLSGHYKVVCYFTNWAWYRKGAGRYVPEDINTDLCTHVVYGFAVLDYSELTIRTHDSWADIDNKFYERVAGLKSKGVKVSLALGGWNDSQGDKYSRLVRSPAARKRFVNQALEFVERFGFEGLDLDWEYPVCWQVDCKKGFADEKEGFAALVRELHAEFNPKGLLLSSAVSPSKMVIDAGYDVPTLAKYLDWIAVMTYDYHGQWDKKTGHVAPLYHHPDDEIETFNANFTMHYWMEQGAPAEKLVMGMPLYGQSFQLADAKRNGLNAKAPGPGQAGEFTRAAGFLAYYEVINGLPPS